MVNGSYSQPTPVSSGVPQGSVLGPLLFLLYINDLPEALNCNKTSVHLFADDAILYRSIDSHSDCQILQNQLCRVAQWAKAWQLKFNVAKCTSTSMCPAKINFKYDLENTEINQVTSFIYYLGVSVSNSLSFKIHISQVIRKATNTLYMLMRALKGASSLAKKTAYFSVCLPLLEYASEIWNPSFKYLIHSMESVNRRVFRWVYSYKKFDVITCYMNSNDWPTLEHRRSVKDRRSLDKIVTPELLSLKN